MGGVGIWWLVGLGHECVRYIYIYKHTHIYLYEFVFIYTNFSTTRISSQKYNLAIVSQYQAFANKMKRN